MTRGDLDDTLMADSLPAIISPQAQSTDDVNVPDIQNPVRFLLWRTRNQFSHIANVLVINCRQGGRKGCVIAKGPVFPVQTAALLERVLSPLIHTQRELYYVNYDFRKDSLIYYEMYEDNCYGEESLERHAQTH